MDCLGVVTGLFGLFILIYEILTYRKKQVHFSDTVVTQQDMERQQQLQTLVPLLVPNSVTANEQKTFDCEGLVSSCHTQVEASRTEGIDQAKARYVDTMAHLALQTRKQHLDEETVQKRSAGFQAKLDESIAYIHAGANQDHVACEVEYACDNSPGMMSANNRISSENRSACLTAAQACIQTANETASQNVQESSEIYNQGTTILRQRAAEERVTAVNQGRELNSSLLLELDHKRHQLRAADISATRAALVDRTTAVNKCRDEQLACQQKS